MVDDIAGRIRYWRERRGLSRRACAELAGYSEGWLKKIEQGQRRIDRLPVLDQLARVLRVPLAELLGEPASAGQRADAGVAELADDQEVHAVDVDVVMPVVLRHLRSEDDQVLRLFLGLQARLGGDDLYLPLARHAERLSASLQTRMSRQRLATLGRLLQMAGWLAIDSNRHRAARQHLAAALYVAHEVDDTALAASALAYMSLQQVYLHDHAKALSLARTAAETTHASVSPLVGAMLGTRLARAYARLGGRRECVAALDRAYGNLSKAGGSEEPVWITYVDEVEVSAQAGACYLDLGMTAEADQYLQKSTGTHEAAGPGADP